MSVDNEPSFNWLVSHTTTKCDSIIALFLKHSANLLSYNYIDNIIDQAKIQETEKFWLWQFDLLWQ